MKVQIVIDGQPIEVPLPVARVFLRALNGTIEDGGAGLCSLDTLREAQDTMERLWSILIPDSDHPSPPACLTTRHPERT